MLINLKQSFWLIIAKVGGALPAGLIAAKHLLTTSLQALPSLTFHSLFRCCCVCPPSLTQTHLGFAFPSPPQPSYIFACFKHCYRSLLALPQPRKACSAGVLNSTPRPISFSISLKRRKVSSYCSQLTFKSEL